MPAVVLWQYYTTFRAEMQAGGRAVPASNDLKLSGSEVKSFCFCVSGRTVQMRSVSVFFAKYGSSFLADYGIDFPRVLCYIKDGRLSASGMIFPRWLLKPATFLERMIVMKKMRKLLAVLAAGVLALCSLSVSASAETITIGGVDGEINTEPVYALGKDLSLYPKGDADLDGEVTIYDACLLLWNTACFMAGYPDVLTEDQIQVANIDEKADMWDNLTNRRSLLSIFEAQEILVYVNLQNAGFDDVTIEDVVARRY